MPPLELPSAPPSRHRRLGLGRADGAAFSGFAVKAFTQIAIGVRSRRSAGADAQAKLATQGVRTSVSFGEDAPATIILGRYATAGDLVYAGSYGDDNEIYMLVLELGDLPARLRRVMVNGEWVNLSATEGERGKGVVEYRRKGRGLPLDQVLQRHPDRPSAYLRDKFGDDPVRPWEADMVGRGIPYAMVIGPLQPEGPPRRAGGAVRARRCAALRPAPGQLGRRPGPQRWNDPSTWSGFGDPANENPVVQIYNIMLGLRDPVTDAQLWGGSDIDQRDLPVASWFAAMNECDADAAGDGGLVSRSTAPGIEIALEDETEPADVIDELLKACQGQIAEAAGSWVVRAGPPGAAVFAFSDDDVIVTSPEELDPFPGLDQVFNGVTGRYPEPEDGWADKEAPIRLNASYRAEDGGRLRVAPLLPGGPLQRPGAAADGLGAQGQRRFRRHTVVLPPEARALGPLDVVEWTSARHGYEASSSPSISSRTCRAAASRWRSARSTRRDYDFAAGDLLPTTTGFLGRPPRLPQPIDFACRGRQPARRRRHRPPPGIRLDWNPATRPTGVRYQLQLSAGREQLPLPAATTTPTTT